MLRKGFALAALGLAFLAGPALAAGGAEEPKTIHWSFEGPFGRFDKAALQFLGAALLVAHAPRAMIDLNRAPDDVVFGEAVPTSREICWPVVDWRTQETELVYTLNGTEYRWTGGSAGGSNTEWRLEAAFEPGAPAAARKLIEAADPETEPIETELVDAGAEGLKIKTIHRRSGLARTLELPAAQYLAVERELGEPGGGQQHRMARPGEPPPSGSQSRKPGGTRPQPTTGASPVAIT